jgi:2-amino-4-hydroxy-6-hydroxymethyldihydropteridine diphosphokinase
MIKYIIGAGSSHPNGKAYLNRAFQFLNELTCIKIHCKSKLYKNVGLSCKEHLLFLNIAIAISSALMVDALWFELYNIEKFLGRLRPYKNSARTVDLDILWANRISLSTLNIKIPHCEFLNRIFTLKCAQECANKCSWIL